jgi:hypothetical protein
MKNGEQSAFSCVDTICPDGTRTEPLQAGLTKREYFAGIMLQGIVSSNECGIAHSPKTAVEWALGLTDELLKQLYND